MGMAPRRLDNSTAWQYAFALSTGNKNTESKWFAIRPGRLADVLQRLQKGLDGTAGLLLLGYGDTLYGDWGADEYITRVQAEEMISDALRGLPEERSLALCGANLYGALIAGRVAEAPLHSSGYDLTDGDVPFYSMVMGEFAILSSVPLNALGDGALLSCMAAGMAPAFRVTGDSPAVYGESRLNFLYNSRFDARWKDMTAAAAAWKEVRERTEGSLMTSFERQGDVSISTYENGVHLAVNHGTEEAAADGRTIPAGGWLIY